MKSSPVGTETKPLLRTLGGERISPPPVWLMRQAGRYLPEYRRVRSQAGSFLDLCYAPPLAAEVTLQPVERFALDGAIVFSDILVVPDALGQSVSFRESEGPVLEPVRSSVALATLAVERVEERLAPVYETLGRVRERLAPGVALIGFAGAPWTLATYMVEGGTSRDFQHVKSWALGASPGFDALIEILVEATRRHLCAQVAAGAEVVQIFDSWAGVLPEAAFRRWVIEPTRALVEGFRQLCPRIPVIGFPRGAGAMYPDYVAGTGVDAVGLDSAVPLGWAARTLQGQAVLQGNLDPVLLLSGGPAMEAGVREIVAALAAGPFIFNLGHGVLPKTPPAHVAALLAAVRAE